MEFNLETENNSNVNITEDDYLIDEINSLDLEKNDNIQEIKNYSNNNIEDEEKINIVDEMFFKLNQQFTNSQMIIKTLSLNLKILQKEVIKERKEYLKILSKNKKKKKKNVSGFAKPTLISDDLADVLGENRGSKLARTDVTKLLSEYIKKNNLQNPENKKEILLDDNLKKLFEKYVKNNKIEWFGMQKHLKHHFIKE